MLNVPIDIFEMESVRCENGKEIEKDRESLVYVNAAE